MSTFGLEDESKIYLNHKAYLKSLSRLPNEINESDTKIIKRRRRSEDNT